MLCTGPQYLGDFPLAATFSLKFTTFAATGAPTTLSGVPVISIYKNSDATESTTGITLTVDFDGVTGLNDVAIDTTNAFYAAGSTFSVVITTGTVSAVSVVGYVVGSFSINARSSLRPTVAGRTLDVSATGEGGVDWANVGSPTTTLALTGTTISTAQVAASVTGNVGGNVNGNVVGNVNGNVVGNLGGTLTSATRNAIADSLLLRDQTLVSSPALNARVPLNAIRLLNCKWTVAANTLTVYAEDDTTIAWSATETVNAGASPITGSDPA